jgi:putative phosphoesterase
MIAFMAAYFYLLRRPIFTISLKQITLTRIGLISDTHGYLDENVFKHFEKCDEIWHAGDFGSFELATQLAAQSGLMLRGVYGNIDGQDIRAEFPEQLVFMCEDVKVMMRHIGGSPPKYNPETRKELSFHQPLLFIAGHSHILKIIYDEKINCLHINPGAAGKHGWHKIRTIVRLVIDGNAMKDCEVIELGKK